MKMERSKRRRATKQCLRRRGSSSATRSIYLCAAGQRPPSHYDYYAVFLMSILEKFYKFENQPKNWMTRRILTYSLAQWGYLVYVGEREALQLILRSPYRDSVLKLHGVIIMDSRSGAGLFGVSAQWWVRSEGRLVDGWSGQSPNSDNA